MWLENDNHNNNNTTKTKRQYSVLRTACCRMSIRQHSDTLTLEPEPDVVNGTTHIFAVSMPVECLIFYLPIWLRQSGEIIIVFLSFSLLIHRAKSRNRAEWEQGAIGRRWEREREVLLLAPNDVCSVRTLWQTHIVWLTQIRFLSISCLRSSLACLCFVVAVVGNTGDTLSSSLVVVILAETTHSPTERLLVFCKHHHLLFFHFHFEDPLLNGPHQCIA